MQRRSFLKISILGVSLATFGNSAFAKGATNSAKLKIAILAATGKAGRLITLEALSRGHFVSAFVRDSYKAKDLEAKGAKVVQKDIFALTSADLQGFDVVIDAFGEWKDFSLYKKHGEHLANILQDSAVRLLIVGGAGSLYMDKSRTKRLMDMPNFPKAYKDGANAQAEVLAFLRTQKGLNWVYVSPPAEFIADAPKSGTYKLIGEEFETNDKGESKGAYADYAIAMLDIAENNALNQVRVGVIEP